MTRLTAKQAAIEVPGRVVRVSHDDASRRLVTRQRRLLLRFTVCVMLATCLILAGDLTELRAEESTRTATVGRSVRIEQVFLPGTKLVVRPQIDGGPIVLRILESFSHGDGFRYDLEYYGLEPGTYDLTEFLQATDGTTAEGLPEINVVITPVLPPGQVEPNALRYESVRGLGGYRRRMTIVAVAWVLGLLLLLFVGRRRRGDNVKELTANLSLADRLRPMVTAAIAGQLPKPQIAELEMMLVAYWRRRLNLEDSDAATVIPTLRQDAEAGPLLKQLEAWLHQPERGVDIDITSLLEPYRHLPEDALETVPKSQASGS